MRSAIIIKLLLVFSACSEEESAPSRAEKAHQIAFNKTFVFPDSLDRKLVVVSFFDDAEKANSVIIHSDAYREVAYKLSFFSDRVQRVELRERSHDSYKTLDNSIEYVIGEKEVTANHQAGDCTGSLLFMRTDSLLKPLLPR